LRSLNRGGGGGGEEGDQSLTPIPRRKKRGKKEGEKKQPLTMGEKKREVMLCPLFKEKRGGGIKGGRKKGKARSRHRRT